MTLKEVAKKVSASIDETLTYYDFPSGHWIKIRTNTTIGHLNREIWRRTCVGGAFPDTRISSAYLFLETVCLKENVIKYVSCPSCGGSCIKYRKNKPGTQRWYCNVCSMIIIHNFALAGKTEGNSIPT